MSERRDSAPTGPAAAAFLAAGCGCLAVGLATVLAEATLDVAQSLDWYAPVGPLVGKVAVGIAVWLGSWAGLHRRWRGREVALVPTMTLAMALIALGFVATFPPFFALFAPA